MRQKVRNLFIPLAIVLMTSIFFAQLALSDASSTQQEPISLPTAADTLPQVAATPTYEPLRADPADYHIVYVMDEAATRDVDELLGTDGLLMQITKASLVTSWDDVRQLAEGRPIEALIVHPSAYEQADFGWTARAARDGLVMVTLNMYAEESAALRGSGCDAANADKYPDTFAGKGYHYFLMVSFLVIADDPGVQAEAEDAAFNNCTQLPGTISTGRGSHAWLYSERDVLRLTSMVMSHVEGVRDLKRSAANRHLPPTAVPDALRPTEER